MDAIIERKKRPSGSNRFSKPLLPIINEKVIDLVESRGHFLCCYTFPFSFKMEPTDLLVTAGTLSLTSWNTLEQISQSSCGIFPNIPLKSQCLCCHTDFFFQDSLQTTPSALSGMSACLITNAGPRAFCVAVAGEGSSHVRHIQRRASKYKTLMSNVIYIYFVKVKWMLQTLNN